MHIPSLKIRAGLIGLLILISLAAVWLEISINANAAALFPPTPTPQPMRQERQDSPNAPQISFIDNPSAQCYRPVQNTNACYVQWAYMYVTASSSQYIISMTVNIDDRLRGYYSGFFQTSMYVPQEMVSPGFQVECGPPRAGNPLLGNSYNWVIRARETGGLSATNYGSVTCPSDMVPPALVSLSGPATGLKGKPYIFTASTSPLTTTLPLTYTWSVTGYSPITVIGGLTNTQTFTWNSTGVKQVLATVMNAAGAVTETRTITIATPSYKLYLPVATK